MNSAMSWQYSGLKHDPLRPCIEAPSKESWVMVKSKSAQSGINNPL